MSKEAGSDPANVPQAGLKKQPATTQKPIPAKARIQKSPVGDMAPQMVKAYALNLRACPGTGCVVLKVLKKGEKVQPLFKSGNWLEVKTGHGGKGWVSAKYLTPVLPSHKKKNNRNVKPISTAPPAPAEEFSTPAGTSGGKIRQAPKVSEEFTP